MAKSKGRHRLSLIIATLGPSTDDNQELLIMITAGIARQWVEGADVARVLHSDGESVVTKRVETFRYECSKRNFKTSIYLDTDDVDSKNFTKYLEFAGVIKPRYFSIPKDFGIDKILDAKKTISPEIKVGVRVKINDEISDLDKYLKESDFIMIELESKVIVDKKLVSRAKENNCEPIYLAKMPTLMKGQVQSREENLEIGQTLEEGFDLIALYKETSHGPYAARSVKCLDEIAVESEKLRVNVFGDLIDKFLSIFK